MTSVLVLATLLCAMDYTETAVANGDTRTISFYHIHTKERLTITFKRNGRYDVKALRTLNHFLRDWRNDKETRMDPRLFDILWEVHQDVGSHEPIQIVSAYRSPATNSMLRATTRGVARHSQHMLGHAMDVHFTDVPMSKVREAGMRLQRGGVGFYPTSGIPFVHLDVGNVRAWPRMSRQQLVHLFPNGRTVHIPSDGKPLKGYQLALADIRHGHTGTVGKKFDFSRDAIAANSAAAEKPKLIARLIDKIDGEDDEESTAPKAFAAATPTQKPAPVVAKAKAEPVPLPAVRPVLVAMADSAKPQQADSNRPAMVWSTGAQPVAQAGPATALDAIRGTINSGSSDGSTSTALAYAAPAMPQPRPLTSTTPSVEPVTAYAPAYMQPHDPGQDEIARKLLATASLAPDLPPLLTKPSKIAEPSIKARIVRASSRFAKVQTPDPQLVTASLDENVFRAQVTSERMAFDAKGLEKPDARAASGLLQAPARVVATHFGANPTSGLHSDSFEGSSVGIVRTRRIATAGPAGLFGRKG
jgi:uncharacterized protein YcbK (DUF882 family)